MEQTMTQTVALPGRMNPLINRVLVPGNPGITRDWSLFEPRSYLNEYYGDIGPENLALMGFFTRAFRVIPVGGTMLEFGGGPTVYSLITAASQVDEIHFCDYLESNLEEVRKYLRGSPRSFDWRPFVETALMLEFGRKCSVQELLQREAEIRRRVTRVMHCDASLASPLPGMRNVYDIVVSNFCAESATDDLPQWRKFVRNIASLLRPGGKLIMSALKGARYYTVGRRKFPAVDINEHDLAQVLLEVGCDRNSIVIETVSGDRPTRKYQGLMLALATKHDASSQVG